MVIHLVTQYQSKNTMHFPSRLGPYTRGLAGVWMVLAQSLHYLLDTRMMVLPVGCLP